jgi:hypothetical protein
MTAQSPVSERDPRQRRYSMSLVTRTRKMYDNGRGLTPTEILRALIDDEDYCGPVPHLHTIRSWLIPSQADYQRAHNRASARRRRARGGQPILSSGRLDRVALDARMLALRREGLSYPMIARIVSLYHGADLTTHIVRHRLRKLGVAADPGKAERAKAQNAAARTASVGATS